MLDEFDSRVDKVVTCVGHDRHFIVNDNEVRKVQVCQGSGIEGLIYESRNWESSAGVSPGASTRAFKFKLARAR